MEVKFITSKNISVSIALFLIILLSQSNTFNFLLDTVWGRFCLIMLIIIISYLNKILGIVVVLFIIIMFNQSDMARFEGFTSTDSNTSDSKTPDSNTSASNTSASNTSASNTSANNTSPNNTSAGNTSDSNTSDSNTSDASGNNTSTIAKNNVTPPAQEGFDVIGTEQNIKQGKQSNSINVTNFTKNDDNLISPYGGFVNTRSLSSV